MLHLSLKQFFKSRLVLAIVMIFALLVNACNTLPQKEPVNNQKVSGESLIWQKYIGAIDRPEIPKLFDYSYAGYKRGEVGIPDEFDGLTVFNVLDYGAIPNDSISDQEAIQKAIAAAELNKGGIIFFPPGEFLVNVNPTKANPITITSSNIILKGSGWDKNGTTITMKNHMLQSYPAQEEWKVNYMFKFYPEQKQTSNSVQITSNAQAGDMFIELATTDLFKNAQFVQLIMPYNLEAAKVALDGKETRPHWEKVNEKGITLIENHEIDRIEGQRIYLKDPLINDVDIAYQWEVKAYLPLQNVGVEDIYFKGDFQEEYVHHKDFIHDNAWSILSMNTVANSWVRRCRFSNITGAVVLNNSHTTSIMMLILDGNAGHKLTNVAKSSRILTGLINDQTNNGQFHGAAMSHWTSGSVVWRVNTPKQGWDSHADIPKNNLVDLYKASKMTNHGGFYKNEPHHLEGLTLWNYQRVGDTVANYDFWKLSGKNENNMYWGFSVLNPIVVGLHGSITTFNEENLGYLESLGEPVLPESLYEAQLSFRLKKTPQWLTQSLEQWQLIQSEWLQNKL